MSKTPHLHCGVGGYPGEYQQRLTSAWLALPEVNGIADMQWFAERDPTCAPQLHFAAMNVNNLLVFSLHKGAVGAAIHQKEIFMLASDYRMVTR